MFTNIDKNLLIAALESALLYARTTAGVSSLEDLTTQVAALRTAFDADPNTVTDADIEEMIATLQAVEIPDPAQVSRLLTTQGTTGPGSYLAVCSWSALLNKPATFPPDTHRHHWSEVDYKPYTYNPKDHAHAWDTVTDKPSAFPPAPHSQAWSTITDTPPVYPPEMHDHPLNILPETVKIGSTFVIGANPGQLLVSADESNWNTLANESHYHNNQFGGMIALFPAGAELWVWTDCNGAEIDRATPAGDLLVGLNCPYGTGDGVTTVNVPTLTAPIGCVYKMYRGYVE